MKPEEKDKVLSTISRLRSGDLSIGPRDAREAEALLMEALEPLLREDGYEVTRIPATRDGGLDFLATRQASADHQSQILGIEFKYYRQGHAVAAEHVRALIGAALIQAIDRVILLINTRFTQAAREILQRDLPLQVELLDLDALQAWTARLDVDQESLGTEIHSILRAVSREFARLIAQDPHALDHLEWRDLERTIAEIFEGLGFSVTLTPPAKDGGKDVVLGCYVQGRQAEYFVEIKHWRSRSRVGGGALRDFLNVIVREGRVGGLFLSTYGYCDNAFEQLTEIDRQRLRFGDAEKIVALCHTYVKARSGIWSPPENLADVLYEGTVDGTEHTP